MNKTFDFFCGIDISKDTLDFTFIDHNSIKLDCSQVSNDKKGINELVNLTQKYNIQLDKTLFCCENTGIYTLNLVNSLQELNCSLWIENPISIVRSQGLTRGKNDLIDSFRIAKYACRYVDRHILWTPTNNALKKIKFLCSSRDRFIKVMHKLKVPLDESKKIIGPKFQKILEKANEKSLKALKQDLKSIDKELENIIGEDDNLKKNYEIAMSVPYIGRISAMYLLMYTDNFTKIKTYRKAACYAGIAPFEYSSGSSTRSKNRISQIGNKHLKKLLHMGCLCILRNKKGELYQYYERKINEGKHIMSVLNSLRNKILNRVFACIRNCKIYDPNYKFKL